MPKKRTNPAKQRRVERNAPRTLKPEDAERLKDGLKKLAESLKNMKEKRDQMESIKKFTEPVEDKLSDHYSLTGALSKPEKQMVRGERIQWYWPAVEGISVIATYVTKDSPWTDTSHAPAVPKDGHGSRAGQWVVDAVGPSGNALFQMAPETAKAVADHLLSAVGWQLTWRDFFGDYVGEFEESAEVPTAGEGNLSANIIPIYKKED